MDQKGFKEDDFELGQSKRRKASEFDIIYKPILIAVIRIGIAIMAVVIALWLYILLDDFILHRQHQRFDRAPGAILNYILARNTDLNLVGFSRFIEV